MGIERRLHPRATVRLPAELRPHPKAEWQDVLLLDLSAGGAGVQAGTPLASGAEVALRFRLPVTGSEQQATIEVRALMVRSAAVVPPDLSRPYLFGLHFLDLDGEPFEIVRRHVWNCVHGS